MGPCKDENDHEGSSKYDIVNENNDGMSEDTANRNAAVAFRFDGLDISLLPVACGAKERDRGDDRHGLRHQANSRHGIMRQDAVSDAESKGRDEGHNGGDAKRAGSRANS